MANPKSFVLNEALGQRPINMCVYSYPGAGKTVLWGTGDESVWIMDSDDGIDSAIAQQSKARFTPVTDYDTLATMAEYFAHDVAREHPEVRWVVWDSLTLFQDRALIDEITVQAHDDNPKQPEDIASMREYLINMNRIGKYLRMFVGMPINFGVSCHVQVESDPEGELIYMPAVQGKNMPSKTAGWMNVVGYYGETPSGNRRLLTQRTGHYFAKDRFNALRTGGKGHLDNPTLPQIEGLIRGTRASAPAASPRRRRATTATK